MNTPRISPISPPFSSPVADALSRIMPEGVPPLALFTTVARNERVFLRMMEGGLLDRGSISLRDRELVIDRTCFRCGSEYEWGVHVAFFGPKANLSDSDVRSLCHPVPGETSLPPREQLLLRLADELHDTGTVGDALWAELEREWTPEQLVELVALCGFYHLVSFATNALRVPLEPFGARFVGADGHGS